MKVTREFLKAIPKSELHVHLDGSLRIQTLIDLAKSRKIKLPANTEEGLKDLVFKNQYDDLNEYLSGFAYTVAVLQDAEALERTAYELAEDCAEEGIRYLEVRFAPQLHASSELSLSQILESVNSGLDRFKKRFDSSVDVKSGDHPAFHYGIICCAMRMFSPAFSTYFNQFHEVHPFSSTDRLRDLASQELALAVIKIRDEKGLPIVGFDLAGQEAGYPAEDHVAAYEIAHRHFMKKTVHAGEAYGPESIFQAITDLHADRIGHGYHLFSAHLIKNPKIQDPQKYVQALAEYIADRRITLEVSLTSNRQTMPELKNWKDHALGDFLKADLSVSLCTDNRTVSNTTLTDELHIATETFNLSPKKLKNIVIYGFKRSFFPASYSTKRKYVRQIIDFYEKIEAEEIKKQECDQAE